MNMGFHMCHITSNLRRTVLLKRDFYEKNWMIIRSKYICFKGGY